MIGLIRPGLAVAPELRASTVTEQELQRLLTFTGSVDAASEQQQILKKLVEAGLVTRIGNGWAATEVGKAFLERLKQVLN